MLAAVNRFKTARLRHQLQVQLERELEFHRKQLDSVLTAEDKLNASSLAAYQCARYQDEIKKMDSAQLITRAGQRHIDLSDFQLEEGFSSHWEEGVHGSRYIRDKPFRDLSRAVDIAEHDAKKRKIDVRDSWFKIGTAIAATIAAIASIINLFWHASIK